MDEAQALADANRIAETMQSGGWPLVREILEDQIKRLSSIDGITSLKELQAKQFAKKALTNFLADLDTIRSAKDNYIRGAALQKTKDPIFKVLQ